LTNWNSFSEAHRKPENENKLRLGIISDSDYSKEYQPYLSQNKRKLSEQSDFDENSQDAARTVTEKLDESNSVKKLVTIALNNQDGKNEYGRIQKRLEEGANPIEIGPNTAGKR
jgi:hypothetical protein